MCVGRKPHHFVYERNTIYCGFTLILWRAHIVEDKDRPAQLGPKLHSELGITVGLILWMCKPIFSTDKSIVIDISFCVANGIVALVAKGVNYGALINKRRYWPKSVPGDIINQNCSDNDVGGVDMLGSDIKNGKPFSIFCFK